MTEDETRFDKFWEASTLDRFNIQQFAQQLNTFDSEDKELLLEYPDKPEPLPSGRTRINKTASKRRSDRTFSHKAMSRKELALLLSSFYAWNGLEHRGYPAAGGLYTTEIFGVAFNVKGFSGKVVYYDQQMHGLVTVDSDAPTWDKASESLNIYTTGAPNVLVVFVAFPERAVLKYGERGGRFALMEVGAAMQQLALQVAESSKLRGVAAGGMLDEVWKQTLQLENTNAKIALGYLVGK